MQDFLQSLKIKNDFQHGLGNWYYKKRYQV